MLKFQHGTGGDDELRLALYREFGRSSEKLDPSQLEFFSEQDEQTESQEESEAVSVAGYSKKKTGCGWPEAVLLSLPLLSIGIMKHANLNMSKISLRISQVFSRPMDIRAMKRLLMYDAWPMHAGDSMKP